MGVSVLGSAGHCTQPPPCTSILFFINWEFLGLNRVILMGGDRVVGGRAVLMEPTPAVSVFH